MEIKPQALEWIFSTAAGIPFNVSADNLSTDDAEAIDPSPAFLQAVEHQALHYCQHSLPERAGLFARAVQGFYQTADPLAAELYAGRYTS